MPKLLENARNFKSGVILLNEKTYRTNDDDRNVRKLSADIQSKKKKNEKKTSNGKEFLWKTKLLTNRKRIKNNDVFRN